MPASRNAAATTLAPRSWPSSPGLPTSTRILRGMSLLWRVRAERFGTIARGSFVHGLVELLLGLLVLAPRLVEVFGADDDGIAIRVLGGTHHAALQQVERGPRRFLGLEEPGAIVVVATDGFEPPGIEVGSATLHPRADQITGIEMLAHLPRRDRLPRSRAHGPAASSQQLD